MSSIFFHCTTVLFGCCSAGAFSWSRPTPSHQEVLSRRPREGCCVDRILDLLTLPTSCIPEIWAQTRLAVLHTTIFWLDSTAEERSSSSLRPTAPDRQQLQQQLQQHASLLWTFIVCVPLSHTAVLNPLHLLCFGRGRCDGAAVARAHSSLCIVYFRLALPQYTL